MDPECWRVMGVATPLPHPQNNSNNRKKNVWKQGKNNRKGKKEKQLYNLYIFV